LVQKTYPFHTRSDAEFDGDDDSAEVQVSILKPSNASFMGAKIKIVSLINELLFGGDEGRLLSFSRTIDRSRFDHHVLCIKQADADFDQAYGTMRGQYRAAGIDVADLGEGHPNEAIRGRLAPAFNRAAMLARTLSGFSRYLRRNAIDVVDAHLGPGNLVGVMAGALTGTPVGVTTYHVEQWEPLWLWRRVHPAVLRKASAVITDSEACARDLRAFMHRPQAEVAVIPNGVAAPESDRSRIEMRRALGLPEDPATRVIGQVATLLPTKGQMVLLDAAKTVLRRMPDAAFLMVGFPRDRSYKDALTRRAEEIDIADRVRIVSYAGNIGDVWKTIDIHAHPTMLDSLPQAIIEAMSLGLPSVVTPVGGIPTLVDDDRTGLLVPAGDSEALARALIRLLDEPATARRLGDAALERYRNGHTTAIMTRSLENLFANLAGV
jgi:glycosyltransferase involved in cell wall biosynthesis